MPNPPWRRPEAQQDSDPAVQGRPADEHPLNDPGARVRDDRTDEDPGGRARAAGTGEADSSDVHIAGPPSAAVQRPSGSSPEPDPTDRETTASGPSAPTPTPTPRHAQRHEEHPEHFLDPGVAARLRERWHEVQSGFVDDPHQAVRRADELTTEVLTALGEALRERRHTLEGGEADTERLRLALRRYRDLLDHMLNA